MTGLKSGSGDDLWSDDADDGDDAGGTDDGASDAAGTDTEDAESVEGAGGFEDPDQSEEPNQCDETNERETDESHRPTTMTETESTTETTTETEDRTQPYIVRRAVRDKSVQFERDERLTFFVHDDVADGERELLTEVEATLGRDVPKFDLREAVYRAALRNRDDVLEELSKMGYSR